MVGRREARNVSAIRRALILAVVLAAVVLAICFNSFLSFWTP
jgi:hypothetical protein